MAWPTTLKWFENIAKITKQGSLQNLDEFMVLGERGKSPKYQFLNEFAVASGGLSGMNVDGSVTEQNFGISTRADYDARITMIQIRLVDANITDAKFGGLAALTNGFDLLVEQDGEIKYFIQDAQTTGDMRLQTFNPYLEPSIINNFSGTDDGVVFYIPIYDFVPGGINLVRGSKDQIRAVVKDDLTGLSEFKVAGLGYCHFE